MKFIEAAHQAALVKWFKMQYPDYEDLLIHIPNGQNVGPRQGARLKNQGLVAGVPDLMLLVPRKIAKKWIHGLFIEMKAARGKVQQSQQKMHSLLREQRFQVNVCYGWEEASLVIRGYLDEEQQQPSCKRDAGRIKEDNKSM